VVIFEFGLGAADYYNAQPLQLFSFLSEKCGLRVSTLKGYLSGFPSLTRDELKDLYDRGKEYYFVAHP
jgi:hypothetical protein